MPVDEKRDSLRAVLEKKTTEELEELLALDFSEQEDAEPDVEYIMTIMEVINEREENTNAEEKQAKVDAAWRDFQDYVQERRQAEAEAGITEELSHDHPCKTENGQAPRKQRLHVLRYCAAVAAVIVLFCGTAYALGWNVFQAFADWTEETFYFLTGNEKNKLPDQDVFRYMRLEVAEWSDTPVIPIWAPEGTAQVGEINVVDRSNKVRIEGAFVTENSMFTICITIYDTVPEDYMGIYQKDSETVQIYESGGVIHYVMDNNGNVSAMWTDGYIEGHIQGNLSLNDIQRMIDSIYEE